MNKRKNDIFLIAGILVLAAAFLIFQRAGVSKGTNADLTVNIDGNTVLKGILFDNAEEILENAEIADEKYVKYENGYIIIRNGEAYNILKPDTNEEGIEGIRCIEANCRDHVCMDTGVSVSEEAPIICLPHKLSVRVTRKDEP